MKLRIKGNSLRLRLTQGEVALFSKAGIVEETIRFGIDATSELCYILKRSDVENIQAEFIQNKIIVHIPEEMSKTWIDTDQVGFDTIINIDEQRNLIILVEKDFKCLKPRANENEEDMFPNPETGILKC